MDDAEKSGERPGRKPKVPRRRMYRVDGDDGEATGGAVNSAGPVPPVEPRSSGSSPAEEPPMSD